VPAGALVTLVRESAAWAEAFSLPREAPTPLALVDALGAVLRAAAAEQPVLVVLDDADWLDDDTLDAIAPLARALEGTAAGILVALNSGTVRPAVDRLRQHIDRPERGVALALEPLGFGAILEAVGDALPEWPDDARERLSRRLVVESHGLPAVVFTVLDAVQRGLEFPTDTWPAPDRTYDATLPERLGSSLVAAVRLRYRALPPEAQEVLLLLAVAGTPVDEGWIARATGHDPAAVRGVVDMLEGAHWLVSDDRGYLYRARAVGTLVAGDLTTPGLRRRTAERIAALRS
jgi:predicted ATPase